jgi:hypothetical protein
MKEEKFNKDSFIGGWYIDPKVCDDLVKYFENNKHRQYKLDLKTGNTRRMEKKHRYITSKCDDTLLDSYNKQLQKCLEEYIKKYPEVNTHLKDLILMLKDITYKDINQEKVIINYIVKEILITLVV